MTTETTPATITGKLTGRCAIHHAKIYGTTLNAYANPLEDAQSGLDVAAAEAIASEDPSLVWSLATYQKQDCRTSARAAASIDFYEAVSLGDERPEDISPEPEEEGWRPNIAETLGGCPDELWDAWCAAYIAEWDALAAGPQDGKPPFICIDDTWCPDADEFATVPDFLDYCAARFGATPDLIEVDGEHICQITRNTVLVPAS
jgi:hypothetical protein